MTRLHIFLTGFWISWKHRAYGDLLWAWHTVFRGKRRGD